MKFANIKNRFKKINTSTLVLSIMFICILAIVYSLNPSRFATQINFKNMTIQLAEIGCFATAFYLVYVCGGFNFACVTIGNFAGIVLSIVCASTFLNATMDAGSVLVIGIVAAIIVGGICGGSMSYLVSRFRLSALMVTICAARLFEGIGYVLTKGSSALAPSLLINVGAEYIFGWVPVLLVVMIMCFAVCSVFLNRTRYGKQAKLYGINQMANRYSGISNFKTLMVAYIISGILSAVGGIIVQAKYGSLKADYGTSLTPMIMLIVMLSGMEYGSGDAKVVNLLLACMIIRVLETGLSLGGVNSFVTEFALGIFLLLVEITVTRRYRRLKIYKYFIERTGKNVAKV